MKLLPLCWALGEFSPAAEASGKVKESVAPQMPHHMRDTGPGRIGAKGILWQPDGPRSFSFPSLAGVELMNLATGPLMGSSPVEESHLSLGTKAASIKVNTSLAWRACLPLLPALPAERTLCSWGHEAELALPPDRWMTSQRLTPTGHQDSPWGSLWLLWGLLPTHDPWLTSAGWECSGGGVGGLGLMPLTR